jgi:hypothetical protein
VGFTTTKDKITKARENESKFKKYVHFNKEGTKKTVKQLLAFPNGTHDDLCDSLRTFITETKNSDLSATSDIQNIMSKYSNKIKQS